MGSSVIICVGFILLIIILLKFLISMFGNIIRFESFLLGVGFGIIAYKLFNIHPAFCLLIALATFIILYLLQRTKLGFWISTSIFSLSWAIIIGLIFALFTEMDLIWFFVTASLAFIVFIAIHINARKEDECLTTSYDDSCSEDTPKSQYHFHFEYEKNENDETHFDDSKTANYTQSDFFKGINNIDQLKKRYKDLLKIYHPDNQSGDTSVSQEIQTEYETLLKQYE